MLKEVPAYWPSPVVALKIAFVAEAPGRLEVEQGAPLVGASGKLLTQACDQIGLNIQRCLKTNVFNTRPAGNDLDLYCCGRNDLPSGYDLPALSSGKYVRPEYLGHLDRLREELRAFAPNVVVALGNTAVWALCRRTGIKSLRGATRRSIEGFKVVPTYHPAAVLRAYDLKTIMTADLMKALSESYTPDIVRKHRKIYIPDVVQDLYDFRDEFIHPGTLLSVDIETKAQRFLTCLGMAPSEDKCLVIPFWDSLRDGNSYWSSEPDERAAYDFVKTILEDRYVSKLGQNFVNYDAWFLRTTLGIRTRNIAHDTMLEAHAIQPEMDKDLGFLASIHTNEPAYKTFRPRGQKAEKRDE